MIIAADFGGTTIKLGIVRDARVTARRRLEARADHPMSERLEAVARGWESLLQENDCALQDCTGASLALPFMADPERLRVFGEFEKFPGAVDIHYDTWSRQRLGIPLVLGADGRMALLGEWTAGVARGKNHVLMLTLGTGIGCAVISGGHLLRGAHNRAATFLGHSTVSLDGPVGRCGNIGCAEDFASTATLDERARAQKNFTGSALARAEKIDFKTLFALAAQGDACSRSLLEQSLKLWATVLQNAVIAYDPELVVLGGGVLRSHEIILPAMEEHLRRYMPGLPLQIPIVAAALGDDAALIGGETLLKQFHPDLFP